MPTTTGSYFRETGPTRQIDRIICGPCGLALFPTDDARYAHADRWSWGPWAMGQACDDCGRDDAKVRAV